MTTRYDFYQDNRLPAEIIKQAEERDPTHPVVLKMKQKLHDYGKLYESEIILLDGVKKHAVNASLKKSTKQFLADYTDEEVLQQAFKKDPNSEFVQKMVATYETFGSLSSGQRSKLSRIKESPKRTKARLVFDADRTSHIVG